MSDRTTREWAEQYRRRDLLRVRAEMTLGEATEINKGPGWACACLGGPDCCMFRWTVAEDLQRGAHIVAKMLADTTLTTTPTRETTS